MIIHVTRMLNVMRLMDRTTSIAPAFHHLREMASPATVSGAIATLTRYSYLNPVAILTLYKL